MAKFTGRRGVVSIGSNALGRVTSFNYEESADDIEATAMGDATKQYLGGLVEGSGSVECQFDAADTEQEGLMDDLRAGTTVDLKLQFDSANSTSGDIDFLSGDVILTNYSLSQGYNDVVTISFSFRGALDATAIA